MDLKLLMEKGIITKVKELLQVSESEALHIWYNSVTCNWFNNDEDYDIVREGVDAIACRVVHEVKTGEVF